MLLALNYVIARGPKGSNGHDAAFLGKELEVFNLISCVAIY